MAPRRNARVVKVDTVLDYTNLTVKEVLCPICRSILIEPVTLPCNHVFCSSCFNGTMENANLVCPLCRIRIGSWLRSCKKGKKLVNIDYWNAIKKLFPDQIKNKLDGLEDNLDYEEPVIRLAEPGELKREYENHVQRESEVIRKQRELEAKASEELIKKLKEEEEYQKTLAEEKLRLDEEIAKKLAEELSKTQYSKGSLLGSNNFKNNHTPKRVGPLDKFLRCENSKSLNHKNIDMKKDFAKKEYTCRILCQDVGDYKNKWNKDFSKSNLNLLNQKITAELNQVFEVEGNSDSSDSIDQECRYFKPVDYRRNPPCQKITAIKVPAEKAKIISGNLIAPKGSNILKVTTGSSAFANVMSSGIEVELFHSNYSKHISHRAASTSSRKNDKVACAEKKRMNSFLKIGNSEEKLNNNSIHVTNTKNVISSPKCSKLRNGTSYKRKIFDTSLDIVSPQKKNKAELNESFSRLSTPSSPFRGFSSEEVRSQPVKINGNNNSEVEKEKCKLQEKADYELAKKLQDEFDSIGYSTRSSTLKKSVKVTRQTTLDNMISKNPYKV